ncbi:MAG: hypothetical protein BroJett014_27830 [Planctomycetota bacterium]|nr:MAG: hypothetical protein BroJett014_27830 [Planctomycetota bacterium]
MRSASAGSPSAIAFMNRSHVDMVFSEPNGLALSEQSESMGNKNAAPKGAAADSAKASDFAVASSHES